MKENSSNIDIIQLLDQVVNDLKIKTRNEGCKRFEFYLLLSLEIARYELFTFQSLTDTTADAISQWAAFHGDRLYYSDYPDLYKKCSNFFHVLLDQHSKIKNSYLPGMFIEKDKDWMDYFDKSISHLIENKTPNNP